MKAIAKTRPAPGLDLIDVDEPSVRPGHVKLRVEAASVCGTDLHIYHWDEWSASRIHPPRITGHEFCGTIVEVGEGVTDRKVGDFVASESHIVCGHCLQCLSGQGHVCVNTVILGVDIDGGFSRYAVIPEANARLTDSSIPRHIACFQDALGNAVHTAMSVPIQGQTILITGLGPIGLFAAAICRTLGAAKVIGTEVSDYRIHLAEQIGMDAILNPTTVDVRAELNKIAPGGVDATLEMSGHPNSLDLAVQHTRPGGKISLLGVFPKNRQDVNMNALIFKGIDIQGIVGRRLYQTWDQMHWLLTEKKLNVEPIVTHKIPYTDFDHAMKLMGEGKAGKIAFLFDDAS